VPYFDGYDADGEDAAGINRFWRPTDFYLARHYCRKGCNDELEQLLSRDRLVITPNELVICLLHAIDRCQLACVSVLLTHGVKINSVARFGDREISPAYYAVERACCVLLDPVQQAQRTAIVQHMIRCAGLDETNVFDAYYPASGVDHSNITELLCQLKQQVVGVSI